MPAGRLSVLLVLLLFVFQWSPWRLIISESLYRRGSRILQRCVSKTSERGTGGASSPENFCISYIRMMSFYAFSGIFIDTVTANRYERKLTLAFKLQKINMFQHIFFRKGHPNQKGGCPDTLDTPWIRHWYTGPIFTKSSALTDKCLEMISLTFVLRLFTWLYCGNQFFGANQWKSAFIPQRIGGSQRRWVRSYRRWPRYIGRNLGLVGWFASVTEFTRLSSGCTNLN